MNEERVTVDFSVTPAKAKCAKCQVEEEIPLVKSPYAFVKFMESFEQRHEACE